MAKLIFQDPKFAGRIFEFAFEKNTVGRAPGNTLVIDDQSVSAHHCDVLVYGTEVIVRENGSTNGTFVNGIKVVGQMPVKAGQVIRFGMVETRLELDLKDSPSDTATDITAVYAQGKFERDQRRAAKNPPPTPPPDAVAVAEPAGHTLVMQKPAAPASPPAALPPPSTVETAPAGKGWLYVVIAVVIVAMVAAITYFLRLYLLKR